METVISILIMFLIEHAMTLDQRKTCIGSTKANQKFTTSMSDTLGVGDDNYVSDLTIFPLLYDGFTILNITANAALCDDTSGVIT